MQDNSTTRGAMAPATERPGRAGRTGIRGARRALVALVASAALIAGGAVPAATAAGVDDLVSPVTMTPSQKHGALLVNVGENADRFFVDGGLTMSVTQANSSRVELRYSMGAVSLADLVSEPELGIRASDPAAQITMRILIRDPDTPGAPLKRLTYSAALNSGSPSGTASTAMWYSDNDFDRISSPGAGYAFYGTITDLLAAYDNDITTVQLGFDVGPNVVQTPFVLHEIRVGKQTILFDLDTRDIAVNYVSEGAVVSSQALRKKDQTVLTDAELRVPAGYRLAAPFAPITISEDLSLTLEVERDAPNVDTRVRYEDTDGVTVGAGETISKPTGGTITASDLTAIPAGYELVDPAFTYAVAAAGELVVPVRKAAAETFDVTVNYTLGGVPLEDARQSITGLSAGTVLTESRLTVPAGYRLVEPFSDTVINSDLELTLPVEALPATATPSPTPEQPGSGTGNGSGNHGAGKPGSGGSLSATGAEGTVPALLVAGLLGLAGVTMTVVRRRRA